MSVYRTIGPLVSNEIFNAEILHGHVFIMGVLWPSGLCEDWMERLLYRTPLDCVLEQVTLTPKEAVALSQYDCKIVDWGIKPQNKPLTEICLCTLFFSMTNLSHVVAKHVHLKNKQTFILGLFMNRFIFFFLMVISSHEVNARHVHLKNKQTFI